MCFLLHIEAETHFHPFAYKVHGNIYSISSYSTAAATETYCDSIGWIETERGRSVTKCF